MDPQSLKRRASGSDDVNPKRSRADWLERVDDPTVFLESRKSQPIIDVASFCNGRSVDGFEVYFIPYEFDQTRSVDDVVRFIPRHANVHADGRHKSVCAHYFRFLSRGTMVDVENPQALIDMRVRMRKLFLFRAPSLGFRFGLPDEIEARVGEFRNRADVANIRSTARALAETHYPSDLCDRYVIDFPESRRDALELADTIAPIVEGLVRECAAIKEVVINPHANKIDLESFFAYFVHDESIDALLSKTRKLVFRSLAMSFKSQAGVNYLLDKYKQLHIMVNELFMFPRPTTQNVHINHPGRLHVRIFVHVGGPDDTAAYGPQARTLTHNPFQIVSYAEHS